MASRKQDFTSVIYNYKNALRVEWEIKEFIVSIKKRMKSKIEIDSLDENTVVLDVLAYYYSIEYYAKTDELEDIKPDFSLTSAITGISERTLIDLFREAGSNPPVVSSPPKIKYYEKDDKYVVGDFEFYEGQKINELANRTVGGKRIGVDRVIAFALKYQALGLGTELFEKVRDLIERAIGYASEGSQKVIEVVSSPFDAVSTLYCSLSNYDRFLLSRGTLRDFIKKIEKESEEGSKKDYLFVVQCHGIPMVENDIFTTLVEFLRKDTGSGGIFLTRFLNDKLEDVISGSMEDFSIKTSKLILEDERTIYSLGKTPALESLVNVKTETDLELEEKSRSSESMSDISDLSDSDLSDPDVSDSDSTFDISKYINDGILDIPIAILKKIPRDQILEAIVDEIYAGNIAYPSGETYIKEEDVFKAIKIDPEAKFLRDPNEAKRLLERFYSKYIDVIKKSVNFGVFLFTDEDYERVGFVSNYFTENVRAKCTLGDKEAPIIAWRKKSNAREIAENAYLYGEKQMINLNMKCLAEGIYGSPVQKHVCTSFKIDLAYAVYRHFDAKKIFDPFGGWGDRMIAAGMLNLRYSCCDANSELEAGYSGIKGFFKSKRLKYKIAAIEDVDLDKVMGETGSERSVDLVFSSPPFFDKEIYSEEETQSTSRHTNIASWKKWLFSVTNKLSRRIVKDGHLVYYIQDDNKIKIVESLIESMGGLKTIVLDSIIPVKNMSRKSRPLYMFVWKKIK